MKRFLLVFIVVILIMAGCHKSKSSSPSVANPASKPSVVKNASAKVKNLMQSKTQSELILVEGGTADNGISGVTVSSFYMDKYEMTQSGYEKIMGKNPTHQFGVGRKYPVHNVSWFDAIEYCNRRSIQEGLEPCYSYSSFGTKPDEWPENWNFHDQNAEDVTCSWTANGYRLPTRAEWEFAARGGKHNNGYTYSGSNDLDEVAWWGDNSDNQAQPVGKKLKNDLGLYDMAGNVIEWNWDFSVLSPSGIVSHRSQRSVFCDQSGGGWPERNEYFFEISHVRHTIPTYSGNDLGFRVCRTKLATNGARL